MGSVTMGLKIKMEKKKGEFGKCLIVCCLLMAVAYTLFGLYMQYTTGIAPDSTLTTVVFAAIFGELWELSKIKRKKLETNYNIESDGGIGADQTEPD